MFFSEEETLMIAKEYDDYDLPLSCPACGGSGETISGAPGNCWRCKGKGEIYFERTSNPEDDPRPDWEREDQ